MQRDKAQSERVCYTLEDIEGVIVDAARDELPLYLSGAEAQEQEPGRALFLLKHTLQ